MTENSNQYEEGLISVISGNYNTPVKYIKEAIDSVLNQTYTNFEFIIVDDCSTDDSLETIKSYNDPRIKVLSTEKNSGLATALNIALDVCRGEYIARMDLDDVCFPERFEKQIAFMRENPDVILSGTFIRFIDENGDSPRGIWEMGFYDDPELCRVYLLFSNYPMIVHPTWIFNHRLLTENGLRYKEQYKYAQDYAMLVSCAGCARCCIQQEVLLNYRIHGDAASAAHKKEQIECDYKIIQEQLDELHLVFPEELKPLHHRYLQVLKPYDKRLKKWLKEILKANKKYHVYNQKKLKRKIWRRWMKICYYHFIKRTT